MGMHGCSRPAAGVCPLLLSRATVSRIVEGKAGTPQAGHATPDRPAPRTTPPTKLGTRTRRAVEGAQVTTWTARSWNSSTAKAATSVAGGEVVRCRAEDEKCCETSNRWRTQEPNITPTGMSFGCFLTSTLKLGGTALVCGQRARMFWPK